MIEKFSQGRRKGEDEMASIYFIKTLFDKFQYSKDRFPYHTKRRFK